MYVSSCSPSDENTYWIDLLLPGLGRYSSLIIIMLTIKLITSAFSRYALKDMWESERLYIDDLTYCLDTYYKLFTGSDVPEELKNKQETIFSTLPDIKDFHYKYVVVREA